MTNQAVLESPARKIPLDGPVNFRDLGGYRTTEGRTVRWRQVFRADGLETMTDRDVAVVTDELGVETVIDLRTAREIEYVGVGPVPEAGVSWHNVSIIDETQRAWQEALEQGTIVDQYFVMLEGSAAKFVEAFGIVADTDGPLVFHCAAGKDRTGLLAGLLLSTLGVDDEQIGHDYALTAAVLPELEARFVARMKDPRFKEQYGARPERMQAAHRSMSADAQTLAAVLSGLRERAGSPEAWLRDHGVSEATIARLRVRLVD